MRREGLEITRHNVREQALRRFKHLRTCVLARELCFLVRNNRATFKREDVRDCCGYVAKLCNEAGCTEPSDLCVKAAEAVMDNEMEYLNICGQSCAKCGQSRMLESEKARYIA